MVRPVPHTYLIRETPGDGVERQEPRVLGRAIVTELAEDEGAVAHNLHWAVIVGVGVD
jgi:hypothetical protein